jgi:epoxyqueuosine reductase
MNKFPVKISRYSVGKDYHTVLKEKGTILIKYLKENYPDHHFRQGVDSLPVPEKILSRQAGIGWIGKNTNLINENLGSYFFLAVILTDLNLKEDSPAKDRCGTCRACLDACPTGALFDEYKIDAGKCISYFTIETKKEDLTQEKENFKSWVYGCDICQEVCPWNSVKARKNKVYTKEKDFTVKDFFKRLEPESILNLSENEFNKLKDESAMERISYSNYKRNINKYFKDL